MLASESAIDRLRAARALRHLAVASDRLKLEAVLTRESDAWVRSALARVVGPDIEEGTTRLAIQQMVEDPAQLARDVRAQTIQEITAMVTHEMEPLLGTLRWAGIVEVPDFEESRLHMAISGIGLFLSALRSLHKASDVPAVADFSLSDLVFECTETVILEREQRGATQVCVYYARRDYVAAFGDPDLVRLAFLNILRNALEASDPNDGGAGEPVIVNWGSTDRDMWIAVLDRGVGLPVGASRMGKAGVTTKEKGVHMGMGLAVSMMALNSMNGAVHHRPRKGGGVVAEIRWK